MKSNALIGELKKQFAVSDGLWDECIKESERSRGSLLEILLKKGVVEEEPLMNFLSRQLNIPLERIDSSSVDSSLLSEIPAKIVAHYNFMPLAREGGRLKIALHDPLDINALDDLKLLLSCDLSLVLSRQKDISAAVNELYGLGADTLERIESKQPAEMDITRDVQDEDIDNQTIDPSVIKFFNQLLSDAIKQRATDIHLEPFEDSLRIRYRIDGMLHEISAPSMVKKFQLSIASRIKVMANLDIAEKRRPQDGRIKIKMGEEIFDLRISILPAPFGESIVIRILSRTSPVIGLTQLGLPAEGRAVLETIIQRPHGIVLVTGPTGSGKTTTLYACLSRINSPHRKILTIEEPIEYQLPGIIQMQAEPKIGFTFANALRSMLRHDPDVMMVGEIRDAETAQLAVRTALTGHLVFSTLHTNDAASSVTRLLDMGIDSYLVASSVVLVIAQRLVRAICPQCKKTHIPDPQTRAKCGGAIPYDTVFYQGEGCEFCRFTGYHGRTAIFEIMEMTDELREMTLQKLPSHQIKQKAVSDGMKVLRRTGWEKVVQGVTTVEEILRVTQEEQL